jgi:hypothetical protein
MNLTQWGETVTESRVPNYTSTHFITTFSQPHSSSFPPNHFPFSNLHSQLQLQQLAATTMSLSDSETSYGSGSGGSEYKPFRHISRDSEIPFLPLHISFFIRSSVVSRATIHIIDSLNNLYIDQIHQIFIHSMNINWYVDQIHQLFVELLFIYMRSERVHATFLWLLRFKSCWSNSELWKKAQNIRSTDNSNQMCLVSDTCECRTHYSYILTFNHFHLLKLLLCVSVS